MNHCSSRITISDFFSQVLQCGRDRRLGKLQGNQRREGTWDKGINMDKPSTNWCRISSIHSIIRYFRTLIVGTLCRGYFIFFWGNIFFAKPNYVFGWELLCIMITYSIRHRYGGNLQLRKLVNKASKIGNV